VDIRAWTELPLVAAAVVVAAVMIVAVALVIGWTVTVLGRGGPAVVAIHRWWKRRARF
jgi:hypothetical protein